MFKTKTLNLLCILSVCLIVMVSIMIQFTAPNLMIKTSGTVYKDSTVVIDPGHGGADGGAVSVTGQHESALNMAVAEKTDILFSFFGINTVLTRESENIEYPESADTIHKKKVYDQQRRIQMIENTPKPILISIHQNKYTSSSVNGIQVLYGNTPQSKDLADEVEKALCSIGSDRVRKSAVISDTIYLFQKINCPAILLECGFLSNPPEAVLLENNEYQLTLSAAITAGYLSYKTNAF